MIDHSYLDDVVVQADITHMNLVQQIATLKVVEVTQLIANSIFLMIFNLSQRQVLCSFEYF
jgi:hypothetical protein